MRACQEVAAQDRANCPSQLGTSDLLLKFVRQLDLPLGDVRVTQGVALGYAEHERTDFR
jgi:hypothetical protein